MPLSAVPRALALVATLAVTLLGDACAGGASASRSSYFTMRTVRGARQMTLGNNGDIVGPSIQLAATPEGYRGMADSMAVELRSDGKRVLGTIRDRPVDLHVSTSYDGLIARGLFAGQLGRLQASDVALKSNLGACSYELEAVGQRYQGQRACGRSGVPMAQPVTIELPPGFERLPPDRQAMLLAILLTQ